MRVADILRQLADVVDQVDDVEHQDMPGEVPAETPCDTGAEVGGDGEAQITVTHLEPVDVAAGEEAGAETMVSPLQQEHELLKKSQDVDNNVDQFAAEEGSMDVEENMRGMEDDGDYAYDSRKEDDAAEAHGGPYKTDGERKLEKEKQSSQEELDEAAYQAELKQMRNVAGIHEESNGPVNVAGDCKPLSVNPRANAAREANGKKHLPHTTRRLR